MFSNGSERGSTDEVGSGKVLVATELPKKTVLVTNAVHRRIFILQDLGGDDPGKNGSDGWLCYL